MTVLTSFVAFADIEQKLDGPVESFLQNNFKHLLYERPTVILAKES